jgi:hypothetical protein
MVSRVKLFGIDVSEVINFTADAIFSALFVCVSQKFLVNISFLLRRPPSERKFYRQPSNNGIYSIAHRMEADKFQLPRAINKHYICWYNSDVRVISPSMTWKTRGRVEFQSVGICCRYKQSDFCKCGLGL